MESKSRPMICLLSGPTHLSEKGVTLTLLSGSTDTSPIVSSTTLGGRLKLDGLFPLIYLTKNGVSSYLSFLDLSLALFLDTMSIFLTKITLSVISLTLSERLSSSCPSLQPSCSLFGATMKHSLRNIWLKPLATTLLAMLVR